MNRVADERIAHLERLIEAASPGPWLIHSEPEVDFPPSIMKPLEGGGIDMIEPLNPIDQQAAVECRNAAPLLIAEIRRLRAKNDQLEASIEDRAREMAQEMFDSMYPPELVR